MYMRVRVRCVCARECAQCAHARRRMCVFVTRVCVRACALDVLVRNAARAHLAPPGAPALRSRWLGQLERPRYDERLESLVEEFGDHVGLATCAHAGRLRARACVCVRVSDPCARVLASHARVHVFDTRLRVYADACASAPARTCASFQKPVRIFEKAPARMDADVTPASATYFRTPMASSRVQKRLEGLAAGNYSYARTHMCVCARFRTCGGGTGRVNRQGERRVSEQTQARTA